MGDSIFDETMVGMAWPEIEKAAAEGAVVLLPTGVIEEHGPHMGLGVDIYCSYLVCKHTRRRLEERGIRALIAPPLYWGINQATGAFPGSFTVRAETLKAVLHDLFASLKNWGFSYVFNINWHGDQEHNRAILDAVSEARSDPGIQAFCILSPMEAKRFQLKGGEPYILIRTSPALAGGSSGFLEIHAESLETGIMARYFPDQVNAQLAKTLKSTDLTFEDLLIWRQGGDKARKTTPLGYFGDPAKFDPEAAREVIEKTFSGNADLIEEWLKAKGKGEGR